jgi:hypothetical protein
MTTTIGNDDDRLPSKQNGGNNDTSLVLVVVSCYTSSSCPSGGVNSSTVDLCKSRAFLARPPFVLAITHTFKNALLASFEETDTHTHMRAECGGRACCFRLKPHWKQSEAGTHARTIRCWNPAAVLLLVQPPLMRRQFLKLPLWILSSQSQRGEKLADSTDRLQTRQSTSSATSAWRR